LRGDAPVYASDTRNGGAHGPLAARCGEFGQDPASAPVPTAHDNFQRSIVGYLLGALILIIAFAVLVNLKLPLIESDRVPTYERLRTTSGR